ncbi:DUF4012 domain-containing protein [Microbacterium sp. TWP3-1-2b2]|uniref:DUF4012 domain-containing protein n=1 Tax=Microbacterium sp. TWP3-1-2b2 TaxID=2804651 RepID=UPI003CF6DE27
MVLVSADNPISRRQMRQQRAAAPDEVLALFESPEKNPKARRPRRGIWITLSVLAVLVVGVGILGWRVVDDALQVRSHLTTAMGEVRDVQAAVVAGDLDAAQASAAIITAETQAASELVHGTAWSIASAIPAPYIENLRSVRTAVDVTDDLARKVLVPLSSFDMSALVPKDGGIDVAAIGGLSATIDVISTAVDSAMVRLGDAERTNLVPQVSDALKQLDDVVVTAEGLIGPARDILGVLPGALGAEGPRTYLLMFQGNSEARSLGGNAAVFVVLHTEDGKMSITDVVNSSDFHHRTTPITELDPEAVHIYGEKIGMYTPDFTMVPEFPEAVRIFSAWWADAGREPFDAAISLDPVALAYILKATGPLPLATGDTISADNAAPLLLNEVYFRYEDPDMQNAFFGGTAEAVFSAIVGGKAAPAPLIQGLTRAVDEGRLLYQSNDPDETALIESSRMSGAMPTDNADRTVIGVYANDNTGSKKSYYLDLAVNAKLTCTADGATVTGTAKLSSMLTANEAARLPYYIKGPYFEPEDISTYMVLYGPAGGSLASVTIDGAPATVLAQGLHGGRPAVKVEVRNHLADQHVIEYAFEVANNELGPLEVWRTPMSRVSVNDASGQSCE